MKKTLTKLIIKHIILSQIIHLVLPLLFIMASKHSNQYILHGDTWLLNFDGVHYFLNQYQSQPNHAFLLFFVKVIQFIKKSLGFNIALYLLIGINKAVFIINTYNIYKITLETDFQKSTRVAYYAVIIYLYNPSSIFYNVLYSQSLYCFITCLSIRILLQKQKYNQIKAVCLLSLASGIRSSAIFLSPIIGLQILFNISSNFKTNLNKSLALLIKGSVIFISLILPFFIHLIFSHYNLCVWNKQSKELCEYSRVINIYSLVQQKYWNVGFFKYYQIKNIVFITIGTPSIAASIYGLTYYKLTLQPRKLGLWISFAILLFVTVSMTNMQSSSRFFSSHPLFYYLLSKLSIQLRLIRVWIIFYCLIGILLYTVGFPWT